MLLEHGLAVAAVGHALASRPLGGTTIGDMTISDLAADLVARLAEDHVYLFSGEAFDLEQQLAGNTEELEALPAMECVHCCIVRHRGPDLGGGDDFHGSVEVISEGHGLCLRHFAKSRHWPDPGASGG